jgi:hypothetical protein
VREPFQFQTPTLRRATSAASPPRTRSLSSSDPTSEQGPNCHAEPVSQVVVSKPSSNEDNFGKHVLLESTVGGVVGRDDDDTTWAQSAVPAERRLSSQQHWTLLLGSTPTSPRCDTVPTKAGNLEGDV